MKTIQIAARLVLALSALFFAASANAQVASPQTPQFALVYIYQGAGTGPARLEVGGQHLATLERGAWTFSYVQAGTLAFDVVAASGRRNSLKTALIGEQTYYFRLEEFQSRPTLTPQVASVGRQELTGLRYAPASLALLRDDVRMASVGASESVR
jgi:hypothetical protein